MTSSPRIIRFRPRSVPVGLLLLSILVGSGLLLTGVVALQVVGSIIVLGGLMLPIVRLGRPPAIDKLAIVPLDSQKIPDEVRQEVERARVAYRSGRFAPLSEVARVLAG